MQLKVTVAGFDEAAKDFQAMASRAMNLAPPLEHLGIHHQRKAQTILRSGERGIQARNPAGLADSITFQVEGMKTLDIGSNKPYAASQQFGPPGGFYESDRPGGWLAIPIADNVAARGNPKFASPLDVKDGVFFRSKKGTLLFGRENKRKKQTGKMRKGWSRFLPEKLEAMREKIDELLFVLLKRTRGTAHMYVTHDPPDQERWERFASSWIMKGKT